MSKVTVKVEFGVAVKASERRFAKVNEVLDTINVKAFIGNKKLGEFTIEETVKRQEEKCSVLQDKVSLNLTQKFNSIFRGCIIHELRKYEMKDISLELSGAEDLKDRLSFLHNALKVAGVKDYKESCRRSGFYIEEREEDKKIWKFDKETFRKSLNITTITL